jgi:hypothetical protein
MCTGPKVKPVSRGIHHLRVKRCPVPFYDCCPTYDGSHFDAGLCSDLRLFLPLPRRIREGPARGAPLAPIAHLEVKRFQHPRSGDKSALPGSILNTVFATLQTSATTIPMMIGINTAILTLYRRADSHSPWKNALRPRVTPLTGQYPKSLSQIHKLGSPSARTSTKVRAAIPIPNTTNLAMGELRDKHCMQKSRALPLNERVSIRIFRLVGGNHY